MTEQLEQALAEVNAASDRMIAWLEWSSGDRGKKIQELADGGHKESVDLLTHFRLWYAILKLKSRGFVEASHEMSEHFERYKTGGYVA